ncbi:MAG: 2Fe-2S iron-sulfur cluster binding domain-containing protein, partial [Chloroflexi bacterium]|nr:2Fe-2S iron-sulfur cluster binding domain-containing protein [Chloroflexota bacterium]
MDGISVINCVVNGETVELPFIPGEMLSDLLRERLGLTGTKIGCNEAECGACTVLVEDEPVLSCTYPAARANGKRILTIEGLATPGERGETLHPLQEAFVLHGAVQCGFCIPGQIMTAYALLRKQPDPHPQDVRSALKDTLCRCAGYPTIERAILAAAKAARTGQAVEAPKVPISTRAQRVVGQFQLRPEAVEKVTGRALYSDDLKFEGMLHGRAK